MNGLNKLELRVLEMLLNGNHSLLSLMRQQVELANVTSREMTGVGFFTKFVIPDEARLPGNLSFELSDVSGSAKNVTHGVGFVLFIRDGAISMLEGYTYDEPWPDKLQDLKLIYLKSQRDFCKLPLPPGQNNNSDYATFSIASAIPKPPETQSVATPVRPLRFNSSCSRVTVMRAPVQP